MSIYKVIVINDPLSKCCKKRIICQNDFKFEQGRDKKNVPKSTNVAVNNILCKLKSTHVQDLFALRVA